MDELYEDLHKCEQSAIPWQFYSALCNRDGSQISAIIDTYGYVDLLSAINQLWQGRINTSLINLINNAFNILPIQEHGWVYWVLLEMYINDPTLTNELGEEIIVEITQKLHWASGKRTFLAQLLNISLSRMYAKLGKFQHSLSMLKLSCTNDPLIQGLIIYHRSNICRTNGQEILEDVLNLQISDAVKIFQKLKNDYFYACALLEQSFWEIERGVILRCSSKAAEIFEKLEKKGECYNAKNRIDTINRLISNESKNGSEKYIQGRDRVGDCLFISLQMRNILKYIERALNDDRPILVLGATGTGKEQIAKTIHTLSKARGKFVAINCANLQKGTAESELFGHERGSFTDAKNQHLGCFELAANGTVFLDEIGELDKDMQPTLLRVLQEHQIRRLGGEKDIQISCRIVAATNRNIQQLVDIVSQIKETKKRWTN